MSGPQSRSSLLGPTLSAANACDSRSRSGSYAARSISTRLPAEHVCPAFWTIAATSTGSAASKSASAKTICGDLPPSSSVTGTWLSAAILRDGRARRRRARERDVVDARMPRERRARFVPVAGDDVERAVRQAGFRRQFRDAQQRQARVLGRLHDARVAGRERRADAAPENLQRIVPRHDMARHAVRLADREHGVAGLIRQGFAVQLVGGARVELEIARDAGGVGARLLERLAGVARLDLRDLLVARGDQHRQARENASAFGGARRAPAAFEGRAGGGDRAVDIGRGAARDLREDLAVGRIDDGNRLVARCRDPAVIDEMLRVFHACLLNIGSLPAGRIRCVFRLSRQRSAARRKRRAAAGGETDWL